MIEKLRRMRDMVAETFEEKARAMQDLSEEEMAKQIEEVKNTCKSYCGECPSYEGTGETD